VIDNGGGGFFNLGASFVGVELDTLLFNASGAVSDAYDSIRSFGSRAFEMGEDAFWRFLNSMKVGGFDGCWLNENQFDLAVLHEPSPLDCWCLDLLFGYIKRLVYIAFDRLLFSIDPGGQKKLFSQALQQIASFGCRSRACAEWARALA